jgi:hypothetical protein
MKIFKYALLAIPFLYFSCSDDDDSVPEPINEEEVITTMIVTLTPHAPMGFDTVTLTTRDLDGDGPNEPVLEVSGPISSLTSYDGSIQWLNEMEDEPEDITLEVIEEADEHQVFFSASSGLPLAFSDLDTDNNGEPLGVNFIMFPTIEGASASGSITVTLVHEPLKPNGGDLDLALSEEGSIDIQTSFDVVVE